MSTNDTFLAIFLGSKTSARMTAWNALSEEARHTKMQEGIAAWKAWVEKHHAAIVAMGGPLGKTKKVSEHGIEDISNLMSGYTVVRAESHDAAAKLFERHPHFTIFPGDSVEVMPVLPIPAPSGVAQCPLLEVKRTSVRSLRMSVSCALLSGGQNRLRCLRSTNQRRFDCAHIPAGIQCLARKEYGASIRFSQRRLCFPCFGSGIGISAACESVEAPVNRLRGNEIPRYAV